MDAARRKSISDWVRDLVLSVVVVPTVLIYISPRVAALGGLWSLAALKLWEHWPRGRSKRGLKLGPAIGTAIGLLIVLVSVIWGALTWGQPEKGSEQVAAAPNISFQKFALFWVETEPSIYHLAVVTKLFNADNRSYLLNGIIFARTEWKLVPRGSYTIRRYTEFDDKAELIEDNYIKPNDVGYYKKILPIRVDMTIMGGVLPDFVLLGHWNIILGAEKIPVTPNMFGICNAPLSNAEWVGLLRPRSSINIENLNYFPVPRALADWDLATVVGVACK